MKNIVCTFILLFSSLANAQMLRVAVIDSGLELNDPRFSEVLCNSGHRDFTGSDIVDTVGHGTHIAGLIKLNAGPSGYCMVILKVFSDKITDKQAAENALKALRWAADKNNHIDIINFSGGGIEEDDEEYVVFRALYLNHTIVVAAAGNESKDISNPNNYYYPASYKIPNIIPVGALRSSEKCASAKDCRQPASNYGDPRMVWELGDSVLSYAPMSACIKAYIPRQNCTARRSGTSMAAAIHTGKIVGSLLKATLVKGKAKKKPKVSACSLYKLGPQPRSCKR